MRTILILENSEDRISDFTRAVEQLGDGFEFRIWRDAHSMCRECERYFANAALISLDHDLTPLTQLSKAAGTGLDVARFLGDFLPACPVLIHSSHTDQAYSMLNELRFSGWKVEYAAPTGANWVQSTWLQHVRLLTRFANTWVSELPGNHEPRVERMRLCLDGLGLGDALGEMLSYQAQNAAVRLKSDDLPGGPWFHTDDTEMAISICSVLRSHGRIHQDALAKRFSRRFERDPDRGYGSMTRMQMKELIRGANWHQTATNAFSGQGSMGNGSAMRVAPLGAYFADELEECAKQAAASSMVTHTHPEGIAGAIAVAIGAAMAWRLRAHTDPGTPRHFLRSVIENTPSSHVRDGLVSASELPAETSFSDAARSLGNGSLVTAPDTVPFCIWMAAHHLGCFPEAVGETIRVGGDCDTNAAIVGGIVALSAGRDSIPRAWLDAREAVSF